MAGKVGSVFLGNLVKVSNSKLFVIDTDPVILQKNRPTVLSGLISDASKHGLCPPDLNGFVQIYKYRSVFLGIYEISLLTQNS